MFHAMVCPNDGPSSVNSVFPLVLSLLEVFSFRPSDPAGTSCRAVELDVESVQLNLLQADVTGQSIGGSTQHYETREIPEPRKPLLRGSKEALSFGPTLQSSANTPSCAQFALKAERALFRALYVWGGFPLLSDFWTFLRNHVGE